MVSPMRENTKMALGCLGVRYPTWTIQGTSHTEMEILQITPREQRGRLWHSQVLVV